MGYAIASAIGFSAWSFGVASCPPGINLDFGSGIGFRIDFRAIGQ
jgi:hypothetical protein